jgi:uncharacterized protein YaiE (UPF0345 family)
MLARLASNLRCAWEPPLAASERFDSVSVVKKANVYFDGRCVSHTLHFSDGSRKSVGVILPGSLRFETAGPETMELLEGRCRVEIADSGRFVEYRAGERFDVPARSSFRIETQEPLHYVCHFG